MSTTVAEELTERQQTILGLVVREYIETAQPVASRTLADKYHVGVSPATIRNEMAVLERLGYLTHPHTSAGRVPTERGYRYFVERLMERAELPEEEQRLIRHQFHQARLDLDQWMRLAAAVLAHSTHAASLVTPPKARRAHLKHLELIALSDAFILLIVVTAEGLVRQQMVAQPQPALAQETLNAVAARLNDLLQGMSRDQIEPHMAVLSPFERSVCQTVVDVLGRVDSRHATRIYRDGLLHVLRQPEFAHTEAICRLVEIMERRALLDSIVEEVLASGGVQVIIGGEARWPEIGEVSLVVAPYGIAGYAAGVMGVVGPHRMPYDRAISAVRFVANLMSHLLTDLYGAENLSPEEADHEHTRGTQGTEPAGDAGR